METINQLLFRRYEYGTVKRQKNEEREAQRLTLMIFRTARLLVKGLTPSEIAVELNKPESSVRKWVSIIREYEKNIDANNN